MSLDVSVTNSTGGPANTSPGTGGVEHPRADDHRVRRLVAGTGALDDRHPVRLGHVRPVDQVVLGLVLEGAVARELDALEELRDELLGIVDELLHDASPVCVPCSSRQAVADGLEDDADGGGACIHRIPAALAGVRGAAAQREHALGVLGRLDRHVGGPLDGGRAVILERGRVARGSPRGCRSPGRARRGASCRRATRRRGP